MGDAEPDVLSVDEIERRPSVVLPQLEEIEQKFFDIVGAGNVTEVEAFLAGQPDFNINCVNFQGITALHIAVHARNEQMVNFLLSQPKVEVNDAALYAARENELGIVSIILDSLQGLEFAGATHSSDFLDDTTPLGVAAYYGYFDLIRLLLDRGHRLSKPHPPSCYCEEICKPQRAEDVLTMDKMRIFLYTAVSNPAYICLTSEDPILVAFELSVELNKAAHYQREFYTTYRELANLLEFKWQEDWYEWKSRSSFVKVLSIFSRIPMLPVIVFWILIAPRSPRSKFWSIPVNRFLSFAASYIIFLACIYVVSNIDKTNQLRGPPDSGLEIILVLYVVAYVWSCLRLCVIQGPKRFFKTPWNWYEAIMLVLFIITFLFWCAAMVDIKQNGQRDLERKYWHEHDPTLIAEGTFCIAGIMAFFKLLFICQLDPVLGPLQMSLGKMTNDVAKFIVIFAIIILSFTAGLVRLYQYYDGMTQVSDETKIKTQQVESFVSFGATVKTLFWAIFCMSPIESADVIIENLPGESDSETIINKHEYTEAIGYVAFAAFQFISVIVVLNMLIACMSNTFTRMTDNVTVEWTFGRTEVYVDFMTQTSLPAPFNLIPTAAAFKSIAEFIKALVRPTPEKKARWNLKHCCYVENIATNDKEDFPIVMSQLVQRYFRKKETDSTKTEPNPLQKELAELRILLHDALAPA